MVLSFTRLKIIKQKSNYVYYLITFFGLDRPDEEEMSREEEQILQWLALKELTTLYIFCQSTTIHNFKKLHKMALKVTPRSEVYKTPTLVLYMVAN
jgi:hypothetical protein